MWGTVMAATMRHSHAAPRLLPRALVRFLARAPWRGEARVRVGDRRHGCARRAHYDGRPDGKRAPGCVHGHNRTHPGAEARTVRYLKGRNAALEKPQAASHDS